MSKNQGNLSDADKSKLIEILKSAPDCGDNSCRYRYRDPNVLSGMRTNGGCRCSNNHPVELRHFTLRLKTFADGLINGSK